VIKAESQALLNTLTEHDFRMHLQMAEYQKQKKIVSIE
jgi:hypothetical protein